jgi:hypothetical protein
MSTRYFLGGRLVGTVADNGVLSLNPAPLAGKAIPNASDAFYDDRGSAITPEQMEAIVPQDQRPVLSEWWNWFLNSRIGVE